MPEYECPTCGDTVEVDDDGYAVCYGSSPSGPHAKTTVARPCGICGDPITTAEICQECADETEGDAMTPTWGKHRYER